MQQKDTHYLKAQTRQQLVEHGFLWCPRQAQVACAMELVSLFSRLATTSARAKELMHSLQVACVQLALKATGVVTDSPHIDRSLNLCIWPRTITLNSAKQRLQQQHFESLTAMSSTVCCTICTTGGRAHTACVRQAGHTRKLNPELAKLTTRGR